MTVLITLTTAGADTGPFMLFSNLDGFTSAFETGVPKSSLLAGYATALVPDGTTTIRVMSQGACTTYIDIPVGVDCGCIWFVYPDDPGADANITYINCSGVLVEEVIKNGQILNFCGSSPTSDQPAVIIIETGADCSLVDCTQCNCHTVYNTSASPSSFSYLRCAEGDVFYNATVIIDSGETLTICAIPGSVNGTNIIVTDLGSPCASFGSC